MEESDAKLKMCPYLANINNSREVAACIASRCMMWEPEYIQVITKLVDIDANTYHDLEKHIPDGFGHRNYMLNKRNMVSEETELAWIELTKWKQIDSGDCGLKTKECNCEY